MIERDAGWQMEGLFSGFVALPYNQYADQARNRDFMRKALAGLEAIPGVDQAVLSTGLPVFAIGGTNRLTIEGQPEVERGREPTAEVGLVSPDYFAALKIPVRQGATFARTLTEDDPPVAVVNAAFAQRFWPDGSAIGRRVRVGDNPAWLEIIGIVGDVRGPARLDAPETRLQLYRPILQAPTRYLTMTLRSTLTPEALTPAVREAIARIDGELAIAEPGSVRASFLRNMANLNLVIVNLSISAGMGLLIAAVGLFGVIAQLTAQRTRDIGVRMALGAQSGDVIRMILGEGAKMFAVGVAFGVALYYALSLLLGQAMPGLALPGFWLVAVNLGVLAVTMFFACFAPAARATRINPVEALRAE
jgi:predicted permease